MKSSIGIFGGILLAATLNSPALAAGHGHGGESQAGGLPALEDRVDAAVADITTLQGQVADLLGQSNWAVVNGATGAVSRFSSSAGTVTGSRTSAGLYDVTFAKDVSGCAYVATLGDTGTGTPLVGFINVSSDASDVFSVVVQTFDSSAVAADGSFHLNVSCP